MKAELIRGKLIAVDGEKLTLEEPDSSQRKFPSEGLNVDEAWIKTYLGSWQDWTVIDGVVKELRQLL